MAEIILRNPWALAALPILWLLLLIFAWRRRFKPLGAFLLRLVILVLVTLALSRPVFVPPAAAAEDEAQEPRVLLVDQSASLGAAGQPALRAEAGLGLPVCRHHARADDRDEIRLATELAPPSL